MTIKHNSSKMKRPPFILQETGHAMIAALMLAGVVASLSAIAMLRTTGTGRFGARATSYAKVERQADGMIEYAYGVWRAATLNADQALKNGDANNLVATAPVASGYAYAPVAEDGPLSIKAVDAYGNPLADLTAKPTRILTYLADYPGWKGFTYNYVTSVRMQATTGPFANTVKAGTRRYFQYTEVPLFQAMYFYEHNLEIYRPAQMIVGGLVHSNSRLLLSGSSDQTGTELTFQGNVSYAGGNTTTLGYTTTEPPPGGPTWAGFTTAEAPSKMEPPTFSNGGQSAQLSRVDRYEPLGNKPAAVINTSDTNTNNDSFHELIELPNTAQTDPPEIAKRRMATKAGITMRINTTISGVTTTTNITVTAQNGTTLTSTQITNLKAAMTGKTTFYDQREAASVDVASIDVSKLTPVLNGVAGFNGLLYVYDDTTQSTADPEKKTLRLTNGGVLPDNGLTVATSNPLYVQGDYNTGTTTSSTAVPANNTGNPNNTDSPVVSGYTRKPAAVVADAVMLLSNSWSDAKASLAVDQRVASNTTYNMAIMAGFMPSGWDPDGSGGQAAYGYSGGANNFPRFLEYWTGKSCTYFGSMVELFESKSFTGDWDTGVIYRPPNRRWNFDPNFANNPPPGSVDAVVTSRGTWARL